MKSLQNLLKSWRLYGSLMVFLKVLHYLRVISIHHPLDFFIDEIDEGVWPQKKDNELQFKGFSAPITFREITASEIDQFQFPKGHESLAWMKEQYEHGSRSFAALDGNMVTAIIWANTQYADLDYIKRPFVRLPSNFVYMHGSITAPIFRGRGIASHLRHFLIHQMIKNTTGLLFVAAVYVDNAGAQYWHRESLHAIEWGQIHYVKWGQREFWFKRLKPAGKKAPDLFDHVVSLETVNEKATLCVAK